MKSPDKLVHCPMPYLSMRDDFVPAFVPDCSKTCDHHDHIREVISPNPISSILLNLCG
jgi:hypothetical protein